MSICFDGIFVEAKDPLACWVVYSAEIDDLQAVDESGRVGTIYESQLVLNTREDGSFSAVVNSFSVSLISKGEEVLDLTFLGVV